MTQYSRSPFQHTTRLPENHVVAPGYIDGTPQPPRSLPPVVFVADLPIPEGHIRIKAGHTLVDRLPYTSYHTMRRNYPGRSVWEVRWDNEARLAEFAENATALLEELFPKEEAN